jgi:sodium-coupled monocarboxylate transporter 8/12
VGSTLDINRQAGHLEWLNTSPAPTETFSMYAVFIGGTTGGLIQTISDQIAVQRILSASSAREATRAYWFKFLLVPLSVWPTLFAGLALFSFYNDCDSEERGSSGMCNATEPLSTGTIVSPDQILPFFAMTQLPAGLSGLVISGILAATMSTISSGLSSLTTVVVTDFLLPSGLMPPLDPGAADDESAAGASASTLAVGHHLRVCRGLTVAGAVAVMVASLLISSWGGAVFEMDKTLQGVTGGPLLG